MTPLTLLSVGLRVSTDALSISSPVLKRILADIQPLQTDNPEEKPTKLLTLTDDDGEAMFLMLNILHLQNSALPPRMEPTQLSTFVELAAKYECVPAVGRAATPWFDYIYTRDASPPLYQMTQAAMVLGDAVYFARFSSRWVLHESLDQQLTPNMPLTPPYGFLSKVLLQRQRDALLAVRVDIDDLVNPLAESLASEYTHYVDSPAGDDPTPVEMGGDPDPQHCVVDKEGAVEYLGALRDAKIWPASRWPTTNLLAITQAVMNFRVPEYDASENCHFCYHVEDEFAEALIELKQEYKDRLWGLCLDCFAFRGMRPGKCTIDHDKMPPHPIAARHCGNASGHQGQVR